MSLIKTIRVDPILRWAGSKRKLLPRLFPFWKPTYRTYVEPFAGSACLFFHIRPACAVLGDLNAELITAYELICSNPDVFHKRLAKLPTGEDYYYRCRAQEPQTLSDFERSIRFVYLNRHCFNGIYRTNTAGKFNVPYGGSKTGALPSIEAFRKCAILLNNAKLRDCDFGKILSSTREGDFVHIDPPYAVKSRRVFRQYGSKEFVQEDLLRLSLHLIAMDERGLTLCLNRIRLESTSLASGGRKLPVSDMSYSKLRNRGLTPPARL